MAVVYLKAVVVPARTCFSHSGSGKYRCGLQACVIGVVVLLGIGCPDGSRLVRLIEALIFNTLVFVCRGGGVE